MTTVAAKLKWMQGKPPGVHFTEPMPKEDAHELKRQLRDLDPQFDVRVTREKGEVNGGNKILTWKIHRNVLKWVENEVPGSVNEALVAALSRCLNSLGPDIFQETLNTLRSLVHPHKETHPRIWSRLEPLDWSDLNKQGAEDAVELLERLVERTQPKVEKTVKTTRRKKKGALK